MKHLVLTVGAILLSALACADARAPWAFTSAKLVPDPAVGREISADVHEIALPSRRSIGWWTTTRELTSTGGVHFAARAEITLAASDADSVRDGIGCALSGQEEARLGQRIVIRA